MLAIVSFGCQPRSVSDLSEEVPSQTLNSEQSNPFRDAVNKAIEAANLTQTAKTYDEWSTVSDAWQQAIGLMQSVPTSSPNYETAQAKVIGYQKNLEYARQNVQAIAQRGLSDCETAMQAAASVSVMEDQVEDIDPAIRSCKSMDELSAASEKFPAALDGVDPKTFVSNRCRGNESLKTTSICQTLLSAMTTVYYLAVSPGSPAPDDPVPVADRETIEALIAAAQAEDRIKVEAILASPDVALIPGGAIVDLIGQSGEFVQVKLRSRDIRGNDLSGEVRWTGSRFVQSQQF